MFFLTLQSPDSEWRVPHPNTTRDSVMVPRHRRIRGVRFHIRSWQGGTKHTRHCRIRLPSLIQTDGEPLCAIIRLTEDGMSAITQQLMDCVLTRLPFLRQHIKDLRGVQGNYFLTTSPYPKR